jgi:glycosyltransferase involved in cell wall biosynthesis
VRIAHVTSSISRIGAGVSKVVRDLSEAQAGNDDAIHIFTLMDQFTHVDQPNHAGITLSACPVTFAPRFGYSRPLQRTLSEHAGSIDVIHLHGLWMYPNQAAGIIARKSAIPYIMSPHGMLDSRSLNLKKWKKLLVRSAFEDRNIKNAACLHACSEMEAEHIRQFGYAGPIAIIPSGLALSELHNSSSVTPVKCPSLQKFPQLGNKKILLYLSRLHEQKGLNFLLEAWQSVSGNFPDWHLVIAGDGEPAYVAELQRTVREAELTDSVTFTGPVHGDDKWGLLKKANIFVLPTYSENFGLVVAEALACGVPVITTKGTPWSYLETKECGWWIDIGAKPLEECLVNSLPLSRIRLSEMGERGRRLVEAKYMIDITARTMHGVYEWMLNGGPVPGCMRLD